jgi:hypothetical protein
MQQAKGGINNQFLITGFSMTTAFLLKMKRNLDQCQLFSPFSPLPAPQLPLCNNYWQPEIRWVLIILCAFCQKNFFFAIKLHKKKIIVASEID